MAKNAFGINESIVFAPQGKTYAYRSGIGMFPSAEWATFFDDFNGPIASNLPAEWTATVKDTNATIITTASTTLGGNGQHGVLEIAGTLASDGAAVYRPKTIMLNTDKSWFIETRVSYDTPAEQVAFMGLTDLTATTNPEDLYTTTAASLAAWGTSASASTGTLIYDLSNAGPQSDTFTLPSTITAGSWYVYGLGYSGSTGTLQAYLNGNLVGTATIVAKVPVGVLLAPFFAFRNGATTTAKSYIDYFRYSIQR